MPQRIFAYGTLEIPELMHRVVGRELRSEAAELRGYARYLVAGRPYPGIVQADGARTSGRVYHGIDEAALTALDRFEGDLYERRNVVVFRADGSLLDAQVFAVPASQVGLLSRDPWDRARFEREHLADWLSARD